MKKTITIMLTSLLLAGSLWADDFSFDSFDTEEDGSSAVEINGYVTADVRAYVTEDSLKAIADLDDVADEVELSTELGLKVSYEGPDFAVHSDFVFKPELKDGKIAESSVLVNEAYGQYFGANMSVEAGLMKVVWGKADEFHVVDVLNNLNMSEFLVPDYLKMMDPELMFKLNFPLGMASNLEVVYIPTLTVDRFDGSGRWSTDDTRSLTTAATSFSEADIDIFSDTNTLDFSQGALHFTSSAGGFDYGFTYYGGYNKMPSVNQSALLAAETAATAAEAAADEATALAIAAAHAAAVSDPSAAALQTAALTKKTEAENLALEARQAEGAVTYDPMHIFGVEAGYILAGFNLKAEFAYHMTYDFAGDNANVHNNSIRWVGGFDRDIPLGNLNINIQEAGTVILNNDKIASALDTEYNAEGHYTNNMLIVALTDKFFNDKLKTKLIGFLHFEDYDFGIYPAIEYTPADDFTLAVEGRFFGGKDGTLFGEYKDNNFVELSLSWNF